MERKYSFITNRLLQNKAGQEKGRIRILVKTGSNTAETDYVCPECGLQKHVEIPWVRPLLLKCAKCGITIKVPKLKDEIKKDTKKEKKKMEEQAGKAAKSS
jgi:ribosomal protein L37AE/L43A